MASLVAMAPFPDCATINIHFKSRRSRSYHRTKEKLAQSRGDVPALDEILEILTPLDPILFLVLQLRDRLPHDISKQINQPRFRLHFRAVGGERKAVLRDFQKGDAEGPNVRGDGVGFASDALRCHVVGGANEGVGVPFGTEFAADSEVA